MIFPSFPTFPYLRSCPRFLKVGRGDGAHTREHGLCENCGCEGQGMILAVGGGKGSYRTAVGSCRAW